MWDKKDGFSSIRKGDSEGNKSQKVKANQLMTAAGLGDWKGPCSLEHIAKLEEKLPSDFHVKVYTQNWFSRLSMVKRK